MSIRCMPLCCSMFSCSEPLDHSDKRLHEEGPRSYHRILTTRPAGAYIPPEPDRAFAGANTTGVSRGNLVRSLDRPMLQCRQSGNSAYSIQPLCPHQGNRWCSHQRHRLQQARPQRACRPWRCEQPPAARPMARLSCTGETGPGPDPASSRDKPRSGREPSLAQKKPRALRQSSRVPPLLRGFRRATGNQPRILLIQKAHADGMS